MRRDNTVNIISTTTITTNINTNNYNNNHNSKKKKKFCVRLSKVEVGAASLS